jgi:hypothetical protein
MRFLLLIVLSVLVPATGFAQGEYLDGKQSGFGMALGVARSEQATSIGGGLGYSFKSIFDLSLGYAKTLGDGRSVNSYTAGTTLWLTREGRNDSIRVSLGLSGSVTHYSNQGSNDWNLLGVIMKRIYTSGQEDFLQPWIAGGISNVEGDLGSGNRWLFGIGFDLCFEIQSGAHLFISPAFFSDTKNNKSGAINIGVAVGLPSKTGFDEN